MSLDTAVSQLKFANLSTQLTGGWLEQNGILFPDDFLRRVEFKQYGEFLDINVGEITAPNGVSFFPQLVGTLLPGKIAGTYTLTAVSPYLGNTIFTLLTSPADPFRVIGWVPAQLAGQVELAEAGTQVKRLLSAAFTSEAKAADGKAQVELDAAIAKYQKDISSLIGLPASLPEDLICKLKFLNIPTRIKVFLQSENGKEVFSIDEERVLIFKKLANYVDIDFDVPIEGPNGPVLPKFFCQLLEKNNRLYLLGSSLVLGLIQVQLLLEDPKDPYLVTGFNKAAFAGIPGAFHTPPAPAPAVLGRNAGHSTRPSADPVIFTKATGSVEALRK